MAEDKRKLNANTRNFEPRNSKVVDGKLMFAFTRQDDGKGGLEFIASDGYDKTRNKSIIPDKAFYELKLPKGFKIISTDVFKPTQLMVAYVAEWFTNENNKPKACETVGVSLQSVNKWLKREDFLNWQDTYTQELSIGMMPKIRSIALKKAETSEFMMKYMLDNFGADTEEEDKEAFVILDFGSKKEWEGLVSDYDLENENLYG